MNNWTEEKMALAIAKHFNWMRHIIIPNMSFAMLSYEADLVVLMKSGYMHEIEIKVSLGDLKRELKKSKWRMLQLPNGYENWDFYYSHKIRAIWYAIPSELSCEAWCYIPDFAGILAVGNDGDVVVVRKPQPNKQAKRLELYEMKALMIAANIRMWKGKLEIRRLQENMETIAKTVPVS